VSISSDFFLFQPVCACVNVGAFVVFVAWKLSVIRSRCCQHRIISSVLLFNNNWSMSRIRSPCCFTSAVYRSADYHCDTTIDRVISLCNELSSVLHFSQQSYTLTSA